jgi:PEP-CTERM motif-containing protein
MRLFDISHFTNFLMNRLGRLIRAVAMLAIMCNANFAHAQSGYVSSKTLTYSGGHNTTYATLADMVNHTNPLSSTVFARRDMEAYFAWNNTAFYPNSNAAIFRTYWTAADAGTNPNNTSASQVQLFDDDGSTITSMLMGWENPNTWYMHATGGLTTAGCTPLVGDCARVWDGGSNVNTGSLLSWWFNLREVDLTPMVWNPSTQVYESNSNPTFVFGDFGGQFFDLAHGVFVDFKADIDNTGSYAVGHGNVETPVSAASMVVAPEPSTWALMFFGLLAIGGIYRRKRAGNFASMARV